MWATLMETIGTPSPLESDIFKGAVVAYVASWLAVRGAIRQFSSQKWWERQEEAYREIVEALSRMQLLLSRIDNSGVVFVPASEQLSNWSQILEKIDDLEQAYHESAFRISASSTSALNKLVSTWYRAAPLGEGALQVDQIDQYRNAIIECHAIIIREARRDLKLPNERKGGRHETTIGDSPKN